MHLRFAARLTAWTNAGWRNASNILWSVRDRIALFRVVIVLEDVLVKGDISELILILQVGLL